MPAVTGLVFSFITLQPARAEILVKSGDKIGFMGDSITARGWISPAGYVRLVIAGLEANGVHAEPVPAGVGGNKSDQMLARLDKDVLSKNVQFMTLSCGVNDVWHGKSGVPLDEAAVASGQFDDKVAERGTYKANITQIVDKAQAARAQVILLTATVIHEDLGDPLNIQLAPYNDFLRSLAKDKHLVLADLNALFQERIKAENQPDKKILTVDGVHMNPEGDKLMATGVLQALGLDAEQMKKAEASWVPLEVKAEAAAKAAAEARAAKKAAADKAAAEKSPVPATQ